MTTHGLIVRSIHVLGGRNVFASTPVLQIVLHIGRYEGRTTDDFPGLVDRLVRWLPGLERHTCIDENAGGFMDRLRRGISLAHVIEHITLELQRLMGFQVQHGMTSGTDEPGVYTLIIAYLEAEPAKAALETALRLTLAAMDGTPFELGAELEPLFDVADTYRLGPSAGAIVAAARAHDIPILRLTETGGLVQLGWGVHQKRIRATETSSTSHMAVELCQQKPLANRMLREVGLPVPPGAVVASADRAWEIAQRIGLPVVTKPEDGNQGRGVSVNLRSEAEVRAGFELAREHCRNVLVERHLEGHDFRLLMVNGEMVAAARREPARVVGDGQHTVVELVQQINRDPRRRPGHGGELTSIELNAAVDLVLRQQGLTRDSVPEAGTAVLLRSNSNLSTGGTSSDVTDEVHPANARMARLAATVFGLDVAGIDLMCHDIGRPLHEQGGAIVEVNAAPGLRLHLIPAHGQARDVGRPIVEMLFPAGASARIPVIAVTGTTGQAAVTRLIGHMYETAGWRVGSTSSEGIWIEGEWIATGDCSGPMRARTVLLHPRVEVAVLETAPDGILREGLAFDRCDVAVVTRVEVPRAGSGRSDAVDMQARLGQVVVESVASSGVAVLNADDLVVAELAAAIDARVVYFGLSPQNPILSAHLLAGGAGVFVDSGMIMLAEGASREELVEIDLIPSTWSGQTRLEVENALAATAAAWASGLNPATLVRALTTFRADSVTAPGPIESPALQILEPLRHR